MSSDVDPSRCPIFDSEHKHALCCCEVIMVLLVGGINETPRTEWEIHIMYFVCGTK